MRALVLNHDKSPLMPCDMNRAYQLLHAKRAAIYRHIPFTIIFKEQLQNAVLQPIALKFDPGSKTTGIALVTNETVIFAANLEHRGHLITAKLTARRSFRATRRARKTRYRAPRFDNRKKPEGWLPPSLQSRVDNVSTWTERLASLAPITSIDVETVRFDMQKIMDPTVSGVGYQQGTLAGYEIREYLLEKFKRTCVYCDAKNVPFEVEHVVPKSKGGSNRICNLVLACHPCNQRKDNLDLKEFVADPARRAKILTRCKTPLRDAAAVNATRNAILRALKIFGLPVSAWSGGRTKMNRIAQGYDKDHWIDAACVGLSGARVSIPKNFKPLDVTAMGRGNRHVSRTDKFGFPRPETPKLVKRNDGFSTGDVVHATITKSKAAGTYIARIKAVAKKRKFDLRTTSGIIRTTSKNLTLLQRNDGYAYA